MTNLPDPQVFTAAPIRNRLRVRLEAGVEDVWALVGDHRRLSEYSAGIEKVELTADGTARVCRFRPAEPFPDGVDLTERIRWEVPNVGYATSATEPNPFLLTNDLGIVTVTAEGTGTVFEWRQYYDSPHLATATASFQQGLADIGERLVGQFGGEIVEHWSA
jgi:hypothetical protein